MFNSNFRTGEGREQCAPTRYIDISLGAGPDMCLDSWISLLLSTIQYLQQTRIKLFKIWIFKKSISNVYSTLYKASLAVLLDIGVIPDECHTCPSNFELCEPFQLNQMYMFEIYLIFLALICDR